MPGSCGVPHRPSADPCVITAEIKNRTGRPRWWCQTHGCEAWGPGGVKLDACPGASQPALAKVLYLDPASYPGGVALWGAVKPAYSWGITAPMEGIHVHARTGVGGEKVIDDTFEEVIIATAEGPWRLTAKAATAYLVSSVLGLPLRALGCPRCGQGHLDMFEFATNPHREHQCNSCGRPFWDKTAGVANPCADLQRLIQPLRSAPMPSSEELVIRQADLSGLAVWGSNQAIIWTQPGAETAGIHVHALDLDGQPVADDTFARVVIDGQELDADHVRLLMVQRSLPYLWARVETLVCPCCHRAHFDAGAAGVNPTIDHACHRCRTEIRGAGRRRKIVSNPAVALFEQLSTLPRGWRRQNAA